MKTHAPLYPGEVLREDFLLPLGLSEYRIARDIGVPPRRINEIVKGRRAITADTALRLSLYFAWPAEVWLSLQAHYDRQTVEKGLRLTWGASAGVKDSTQKRKSASQGFQKPFVPAIFSNSSGSFRRQG